MSRSGLNVGENGNLPVGSKADWERDYPLRVRRAFIQLRVVPERSHRQVITLASMRVEASGIMKRVDVDVLVRIAAALGLEWRQLRFNPNGFMINPTTGDASDALQLTNGRHGSKRARYLVSIESPEIEAPTMSADGTEVDHSDGSSPEFDEHQKTQPAQEGLTTTRFRLRPSSITTTELMFEASDAANEVWKAELRLDHAEALRVMISGRGKMVALARTGGETPGRVMSWFIKGPARVDVSIDLTALQTHTAGQLVAIKGRFGRYPMRVRVMHVPESESSTIMTVTEISAKRSGRLLLLLGQRWLRRSMASSLDALHLPESLDRFGDGLAELSQVVEEAGGAEKYIHLDLWTALEDSGS